MQHNNKIIKRLLTCLMILSAIVFTSCSGGGKRYRIGVSQCATDVWHDKQNNEMKMLAFSEDEVEVSFASADGDDERQKRQIDSLVASGIDLLIVTPNTMSIVTPAIERAYDHGVPVILFDRKADTKKYTAYLGADNYTMGWQVGHYIAAKLNGRGRVVEVQGLKGSSPAADRHIGFTAALREYPNIEIIDTLQCKWTKESSYAAAKQKLASIASADVVFGANDQMALGARMALDEAGVLKKKHIRFYGIDGLPGEHGGIKMVCDSILDATYVNPTSGDKLITMALNILKGRKYKKDQLLTSAIVTRDNAYLLYLQNQEVMSQMAYLDELHSRVATSLHLLDNQRIYLLSLALIAALLLVACGYAYYAYITKAKYSEKLQESYDKQLQLTKEVEQLTDEQLSFYTHVSHELRTPLTLMADPVERLLADESIKGTNRDLLNTVNRSVSSLMNLVNEILDFRQMDEGKMKLHLSRFDFSEALHHWGEMVEDVLKRKFLYLKLDTVDAEGEIIEADYEKMGRIFLNLMQIAMRYSVAGTLLSFKLSRDGDQFVLKCINGSVPTDEKELGDMFRRFKYSKGMTGGTAISLANIKAFTDLHHGTITPHALSNSSVEMVFTFPAKQADYEEHCDGSLMNDGRQDDYALRLMMEPYANSDIAEKRNEEIVTADKAETKPVLLVVDDNVEVRNYVKSVMQADYNVIEAANGRDGMDVALKHVPDLVISDVMMPYMDGIEFCKTLKESPATSHIPVILLTARSLDDQQAEGLQSGADAYIKKPFSSKVLLAQAESLLRNRTLLKVRWSGSATPAAAPAQGGANSQEKAKPTHEDAFITRLKEVIEASMSDSDLSVENIGERMGMSRVQLYRKVKALTGLTPNELLRKARLARARQLLDNHSGTIAEIAYKVGFATPSYFSKCFKEEYGFLPTEV